MCIIQGMYSNAWSHKQVNSQLSDEFSVDVGIQHIFILSPLLFILVVKVLSTRVLWEMTLGASLGGQPVVIADSPEGFVAKLKTWKLGMEHKGFHINMKTKFLVSGVDRDVLKDSGKYQCTVCHFGCGINTISCSQCKLWVHKKCSSITGCLKADPSFVCLHCQGPARPIDGRLVTQVNMNGTMLNIKATFCYLGNMHNIGGSCNTAIATQCCVAWDKFRKLLPIFTLGHLSLKVHGKVYVACVLSALLHSSEMWGSNASNLQRLQ